MPNPLVGIGSIANDHTGDPLRTAFQKINALPNPDSTVNPLGGAYGSGTYESKITLAIADAVATGKKYCWITQPYTASLVTFSNAVRMIREGGNPAWWDVQAYGALGNGVADDTVAIKAAIAAAGSGIAPLVPTNGLRGGVVYFPEGKYIYTSTITIPVADTQGQIWIKGAGMRTTYLFPSGPSSNFTLNSDNDRVCFCWGSLTPDTAGTFTNQTQFGGWEDLSTSGSLISSGSVVAHQITEWQYGVMRNFIVENFPNGSIGLYLRGSTMTAGLGGSPSAPHVRLCNFYNGFVTTIGSANNTAARALLLQNADENNFVSCTHGLQTGQTVAADSLYAVEIRLGRNNRFFGCLESGDTTALKTGYIGMVFGPPANRDGTPQGSVFMNQIWGDVIEGFDYAVWFKQDNSGNTTGNSAWAVNPSIVTSQVAPFLDSNTIPGFGNSFQALSLLPPVNYFDGPSPATGTIITITGANPDVGGGNVFACANGGATTIKSFPNHRNGRLIWVRLDAQTNIQDAANGGTDIFTWGRQGVLGRDQLWVPFLRVGAASMQVGNPINVSTTNPVQTHSSGIQDRVVALSSGATPAIDVSLGNYFILNITSNIAVTIAVPTNKPAPGEASNYSQDITICIRNGSGGALSTPPTFNAGANGFKFSAVTNPANGTQVLYKFRWDAVQGFWYEIGTHLAAGI